MSRLRTRVVAAATDLVLLGSVTLLPQLLGGRGRLNADTKQYLYLDPGDLLERSRNLWDSRVGGGTVTHQAIGYLWPMGPYYWATNALRLPDWAAQRLWVGGIQLGAALGALALLRHLLPRHPALLVAAALYGLSPVVLGHVTGQSALLLPFAALPWLVLVMARGLEEGGWRWPATFALLVASSGSLNGSSVFFVLLAPVLWVPFAVRSLGVATPRAGLLTLAKAGALTVACQLWWLVAYAVGGADNLPILALTENVQTTSYTASGAEVLRGLGYWFFYGGDSQGAWLSSLARPYAESVVLLAITFAVPIAALTLGALVRWPVRAYFATLVGLGTVIAVGAFPEPTRTPLGAAFEAASRRSDLVLSLRNTQRAAPLVILGLAGLTAAGLSAITRRHLRLGAAATAAVAVLVGAALPGQWRSGLIAPRFHRQEDLPDEWVEAMAHLDEGSGRILELPGIDFASYRWGHTLDPVSVGLTDRPVLARELVPMGGLPGVSLLGALDRSIQEGWAEPEALAPIARLLGASDLLVRNDLEYERYRTVRPPLFWAIASDPDAGLGPITAFGPGQPNRATPERPMIDELELALDPTAPPPPEVAVLPVPGGGRELLSTLPTDGALVVDGDGEGLVNAAAARLLNDVDGAVLLAADLLRDGGRLDELTAGDARVLLTDTNRKRAMRWYSLRENGGATEPLGQRAAVRDDPSDTRTPLVAGQPAETQTTVDWRGAERVWASQYGTGFTLLAEERPVLAFDGDPSTAWRVDTFGLRGPHEIGIELDEPSDADHVTLVAPQNRPGGRPVNRARVTLDGDRRFDIEVTPEQAADPAGVEVALDGRPFTTLQVRILGARPGRGFAEVAIPGVTVEEVVVLPTALTDALGSRLAPLPTAIVLTRLRASPSEPVRADPETALRRSWELPAPITAEVTGTARLSAKATEAALDALLGLPTTARSSQRLAGDLRARAASLVDDDTTTAWTTPFVGLVGQWVEVDLATPATVATLELDVVADERHSLPTELLVSADGGPAVPVAVPDLAPSAIPGAVQTVRLQLPQPVTGGSLRIAVGTVAERRTPDWYSGNPIALPVALAELRLPGDAGSTIPAATVVDSGCRSDLVTLDGASLPVRITGPVEDALAHDELAVASCGASPLTLAAGPHELAAVPGALTGIDLDRLVLQTPSWSSAPTTTDAPAIEVDSTGPVASRGTIADQDGRPFWLVLDQSVNDGWELTIDGARVDGPRPMGSFAAAWYVEPADPGPLAVSVRFGPQRAIDLALVASLLAAALCVGLGLWPSLRRRRPAPASAEPVAPTLCGPPGGPSWWGVLGMALVAGVAVHPLAVPVVAAAALATRRWPVVGRALPVVLVAAAGAGVALAQLRYHPALGSRWPTLLWPAHVACLFAVILLGGLALTEPDRRR